MADRQSLTAALARLSETGVPSVMRPAKFGDATNAFMAMGDALRALADAT